MKQVRTMLRYLPLLLAFAGLLWLPEAALTGARQGLAVCARSILPSLFPFLVLSALARRLGLTDLLASALRRPMELLFAAPAAAAAPFVLGLTGGYPVGAAALAAQVRSGALDEREAGRLLPVCSNTGPGFLIGAAGLGVFGSAKAGALLYLSHVLAALALGLLSSVGQRRGVSPGALPGQPCAPGSALPEAVREAVSAALNVCGFVVAFSVVTALLDASGLLYGVAGRLSLGLGWELRAVRALLTGLLELGGGVAAMQGLAATPGNLALCAFVLGFGSLSVLFQTLSVLEGSKIKASRLLVGRLVHAGFSAIFSYFGALLLA